MQSSWLWSKFEHLNNEKICRYTHWCLHNFHRSHFLMESNARLTSNEYVCPYIEALTASSLSSSSFCNHLTATVCNVISLIHSPFIGMGSRPLLIQHTRMTGTYCLATYSDMFIIEVIAIRLPMNVGSKHWRRYWIVGRDDHMKVHFHWNQNITHQQKGI